MCGIFLSRFRLFGFCLFWIYLSWIFPFRWKCLFFGIYRLFMNRVLNISELPVLIPEALPGEIPVPLQFFQGGGDGIHAVLTDMGEPFCGIVPIFRHDIMALERFDPEVKHMIVFDVLSGDSPVGDRGDKMRLFLTDAGYQKFLDSQERGEVKLKNHAKVSGGHLHYDRRDRAL